MQEENPANGVMNIIAVKKTAKINESKEDNAETGKKSVSAFCFSKDSQ